MTASVIARPTALYRLYDHAGTLLYIGVAFDPNARFKQHAADKDWWDQVDPARTRIEWLPSRTLAEEAELEAIRGESPRNNSAGTEAYRVRCREVMAQYSKPDRGISQAGTPFDRVQAALAVADPSGRALALTDVIEDLPDIYAWLRAQRQEAVNSMRAAGMSYAQIGEHLGLHRLRVAQIAKGVSGGSKRPAPDASSTPGA